MLRARTSDQLLDRVSFDLGLRFEIFFALELLVDPKSRIHADWKRRMLQALPQALHQTLAEIGLAPIFWATFPDVLETEPLDLGFPEIVRRIESLPIAEFQRRILFGLLHYDRLAVALLEGKHTLAECLAKVPKRKQEWLAFIGLYPLDAGRPEARAIEHLLRDAQHFRAATLAVLNLFWEHAFKHVWSDLTPRLQRSAAEKERLYQSTSFSEFAQHALLRVEVDEERRLLKAVRGGFQLDIARIEICHFLPSAFNDRRYWTSFEGRDGKSVVYFPYFDPTLAPFPASPVRLASTARTSPSSLPELDPALIFRALGDSTRYAIVSLLARSPRSAVDLARTLSLSKPAVSHHISKLREAGLLIEIPVAGAIQLSLKREILEDLSSLVVGRLFDSEEPVTLTTTRTRGKA